MPAVLFYIGWLSVTFSCGILSGFIEWLIDSGLFQDQFVGGIRIGCRIDPCGIPFFSGLIEGSIHSNNNIAGSILQEFFFFIQDRLIEDSRGWGGDSLAGFFWHLNIEVILETILIRILLYAAINAASDWELTTNWFKIDSPLPDFTITDYLYVTNESLLN